MQSKKHSLFESLTNVLIGIGVSLGSQLVLFPLFDIHIPFSTNLWLCFYFTIISIARGYLVRRWYNYRSTKVIDKIHRDLRNDII